MIDIKELEEKVELWKRSYRESERCLIERGKVIAELEENQRTVQDIKNEEIIKSIKEHLDFWEKHGVFAWTSEHIVNKLKSILGDKK